jgi:hypothetical protein
MRRVQCVWDSVHTRFQPTFELTVRFRCLLEFFTIQIEIAIGIEIDFRFSVGCRYCLYAGASSAQGLLPTDRAQMLRGRVHSGFNVHRSRRVQPDEREDLERLAQYTRLQRYARLREQAQHCGQVIRNPFFVEKMQVNHPSSSIIYQSGMSEKIHRNFEGFTSCDFIAAITQHIPDKSFQLVRYYGWYSNKMRGQRDKQALETAKTAGNAVEIIDVSEHKPRRIPSAKRRDLITKVWEADPLLCPKCHKEMRIVSLIDERAVIDLPAMLRIALQAGRILRHLGLWPACRDARGAGREEGVRVHTGSDPPPATVVEPWHDDPFPDYDTEPVLFANG